MNINELVQSCIDYIKPFAEQNKPYAENMLSMLEDFKGYVKSKKKISDSLKSDFQDVYSYILESDDLIPDDLEIGLMDDFIVLKVLHNHIFYNLEPDHIIYMINTFLTEEQISQVIKHNENRFGNYHDINHYVLDKKLEQINDELLRSIFQYIMGSLIGHLSEKILMTEHLDIIKWVINYVIKDDDFINDNNEFGLIDDYIFLMSVFRLIQKELYTSKSQQHHFCLIKEYDSLFGTFVFHEAGRIRFLSDYEKILALSAFRESFRENYRSFVLTGPNDIFTKVLYLFFYQIGLMLSGFVLNTDDKLLKMIKNHDRNIIVLHKSKEEVYEFISEDDDGKLWFQKRGRSSQDDKRAYLNKEALLKDLHNSSGGIKLSFKGVAGFTNRANEEQNTFIEIYLKKTASIFLDCNIAQIDFTSSEHKKVCFVSNSTNNPLKEINKMTINGFHMDKIIPSHNIEQDYTGAITSKEQSVTKAAGYTVLDFVRNPGILSSLDMTQYTSIICNLSKSLSYNDLLFPNIQKRFIYFDSLSELLFEDTKRKRPDLPYYNWVGPLSEISKKMSCNTTNQESNDPFCRTYYDHVISTMFIQSELDSIIDKFRKHRYTKDKFSEDELFKLNSLEYYYNTITDFSDTSYHNNLVEINSVLNSHPDIFCGKVMNTVNLKEVVEKRYEQIRNCIELLKDAANLKIVVIVTGRSVEYIRERINNDFKYYSITIATKGVLKKLESFDLVIVSSFFTWRIYRSLFKVSPGKIVFIISEINRIKHEKFVSHIQSLKLQNDKECFCYIYYDTDKIDENISLEDIRNSFLSIRDWKAINETDGQVLYDNDIDELEMKAVLESINTVKNDRNNTSETEGHHTAEAWLCNLSDGSYRYIGIKQYILIDEEDTFGSNNRLESGCEILLLGNQKTDDPLSIIISKCNNTGDIFNKSQIWRNVLIDYKSGLNGSVHEKVKHIQKKLRDAGVNRESATVCQWLDSSCYRIAPQNADVEIPIIISTFFPDLSKESIDCCIENTVKFKKISIRIGNYIRKYLKRNVSRMEESDICDQLSVQIFSLQYGDEYIFDAEQDKNLSKFINDIVHSIEHLTVLKTLDKSMVPVSSLGRKIRFTKE